MYFSCLNQTNIVWGLNWLLRTKKSSKWIICWSTRCIPLHAATVTECDKKNKKGMPVTRKKGKRSKDGLLSSTSSNFIFSR